MLSRKKSKNVLGLICLSIVSGTMFGCSDYENVKQLGERWELISKSSELIANDYYKSCRRIASAPDGNFPSIILSKRSRDINCVDNYLPASQNIIKVNQVLVTYLQRLAVIADSKTGEITAEDRQGLEMAISNLTGSLASSGVTIPESLTENVSSGVSLIGLIFTALQNKVRKKTIPPVMVCTDDEIKTYTNGLEDIVKDVYIDVLELEKDSYDTNYSLYRPGNFPTVQVGDLPSERFYVSQLDQEYANAIEKVNDRQDVARAFAAVIAKTRDMHGDISDMFAQEMELTTDESRQEYCENYEKELKEKFRPDDSSVSSEFEMPEQITADAIDLTPEMSKRIANILNEYQISTAPYFKTLESANN